MTIFTDMKVAPGNHPRVTEKGIEAKIKDLNFIMDETLTICIVKLKNGFKAVGTSACASPENFDPEVGRRLAFKDALRQMWPLEGYLLRERLFNASEAAGA